MRSPNENLKKRKHRKKYSFPTKKQYTSSSTKRRSVMTQPHSVTYYKSTRHPEANIKPVFFVTLHSFLARLVRLTGHANRLNKEVQIGHQGNLASSFSIARKEGGA